MLITVIFIFKNGFDVEYRICMSEKISREDRLVCNFANTGNYS